MEGAQEAAAYIAAAQSPPHACVRLSQLTALETEEAVLGWSWVSPGLAGERVAGKFGAGHGGAVGRYGGDAL